MVTDCFDENNNAELEEAVSGEQLPEGYFGPDVFCRFDRMVPVNDIKPHPKNPNKHPRSQLAMIAKIIKGNGWRSPLVVSNQSGLLIKGEGRWQTAVLEGWSHVPVDFQDYENEDYELADLIADNELARLAEMDRKRRMEILESLNTGNIDIELSGIKAADLEELFNESRKDETKELYPMAARLHERYDYVLIFADNETDIQHLRQISGIRKEVSYKLTKEVGYGRSIPFSRFLESLKAHNLIQEGNTNEDSHPVNEQGEDSPDTQAVEQLRDSHTGESV